ncbi:MAG UNVERIFIED_CONTAM: glycosyltransferase [Anaerolineae bacterium]|jgi:GT2 family glycosyltransferase
MPAWQASMLTKMELTLEVIVVDSASGDGTVEHVRQHFPQVRLLPQSSNVGFTRGNNLGFSRCRRATSFAVESGYRGDDGLLSGISALFRMNVQSMGSVGPCTVDADGSTQSSRRHFPNRAIAILESTWLQPLAPPHCWRGTTSPNRPTAPR